MNIQVTALCKKFGSTDVLRDINFSINEGDIFGVLGPNGAGKTTLMAIMEGLMRPTSGAVKVFGSNPEEFTLGERARLGAQLDSNVLPVHLTTIEVLKFFRTLYGCGVDPGALLDSVGLGNVANVRVQYLSTGQARRVAVAAAMISRPNLLFLDEPSLGLDPVARRQLWEYLREFATGGGTIVLATNSMEEAERLCKHVVFLSQGKVVALGKPHELMRMHQTLHRFEIEFAENTPFVGIPGLRQIFRDGDRWIVLSDDPKITWDALSRWQDSFGDTDVPYVSWHSPTLEDLFMEISASTRSEECVSLPRY